MKLRIITLLLIVLNFSCRTTKTTMIIGDNYNEKNNLTTLTLLPYGHIDIPGKWSKTSYDKSSKQHHFVNKDSIFIAVTKNPQKKYPFYINGIGDNEFSKKFYKWEKNYYEKQGVVIEEKASEKNYIIWTAKSSTINTIFLYGAKNEFAYNFAIFDTNWTKDEQITFLKKLFDKN